MNEQPVSTYNLGFTAASLRPELARVIADRYLACGDWESTKQWVIETNALQCRSAASTIRLERELRQRLQTLTAGQLAVLAHATEGDRSAIAWLATMKHSALTFDFAAEVLREKLAEQDPVLRPSDYETFVHHKAASQPGLAGLKASSKSKIRQVLLRMLLEVGILRAGAALGTIQRPVLSPKVIQVIASDSPTWLAGFLIPDAQIERIRVS